jgi:hypothetical protein
MWNTSVADGSGYGWPGMGGGFFGGATGGAFGGALVGSLVGDALFPGGFGRGRGHDGGGEKVVQINGQPNGGWGWGGDPWLFKEVSDTRREQVSQTVSLQQDLFGLQRDILDRHCGQLAQAFGLQKDVLLGNTSLLAAIKDCCCNTQYGLMENRYLTEKEICALTNKVMECCCETNMNITRMGYETQLRDQGHFGALMKELTEVKCLVKDVERDGIIRAQAAEIAAKDRALNTAEIIAAMKPPAPVPAYIQANPFENFMPTVRCAPACNEPRWDFNNNCRGFQ